MENLKRKFYFGEVDYLGHGRKDCAVEVEMNYKDRGDGRRELSICGDIWNARHSDIYCGGQCLDTIAEYVRTPLFKKLHHLWKLYHLNAMHPECVHQYELGWTEAARKKVPIYTFALTSNSTQKRKKIKDIANKSRLDSGSASITPEEQHLLSLEYTTTSPVDSLPSHLAQYYKLDKTETKALGWLRPTDHPDGLLGNPCPVCGYRYGTSWNHFPISEEDENLILYLLQHGELPKTV